MRMKKAIVGFRALAMLIATSGLLIPSSIFAATPPESPAKQAEPLTQDVALQKGGVLEGQLVDQAGSPIAEAPVSLLYNNKVMTKTVTDKRGRFSFGRLRGGIYQVSAPDAQRLYRLWAAGTAPKSAQKTANLVAGTSVMRGQFAKSRLGKIVASPLGLTAIAATAVVVPVALNQSSCDGAD